jgi:quercetin dioxygenase-like cupin family protein
MVKPLVKNFRAPSEVRSFEKGELQLLNLRGSFVGRLVLEPGWRWSKHLKPVVKTKSCRAPHFQYHATGTLHFKMDDGTEFEVGPGEVSWVPPGHDAWVVGNERVTVIDFEGMTEYAIPPRKLSGQKR